MLLEKYSMVRKVRLTISVRIVADCKPHSYQVTRKLDRATTLEFTAESAIIFTHCCTLAFSY